MWFGSTSLVPEIHSNHPLRYSVPSSVDQDLVNIHLRRRGCRCLRLNDLNVAIIELPRLGDLYWRSVVLRDPLLGLLKRSLYNGL